MVAVGREISNCGFWHTSRHFIAFDSVCTLTCRQSRSLSSHTGKKTPFQFTSYLDLLTVNSHKPVIVKHS